MHSVSSTKCYSNVRAWATNLEDCDMLGKFSNGDLFAQDAVYHKEYIRPGTGPVYVKSVVTVRLVRLS